jgi:amino acid permease
LWAQQKIALSFESQYSTAAADSIQVPVAADVSLSGRRVSPANHGHPTQREGTPLSRNKNGGTMSNGSTQKLTLFALTAMVVGGMVGSGIFSLPRTFANATGPFGAIIAWCIAAGGMYTLARVFQFLAERKPDLDAGAFAQCSGTSSFEFR